MPTAMAENFFSILKSERIYRYKSATFAEIHRMVTNIFPFTTTSASGKKNGRGAASATPLLLKLNISYQGLFCAVRTTWDSPIKAWGIFLSKLTCQPLPRGSRRSSAGQP